MRHDAEEGVAASAHEFHLEGAFREAHGFAGWHMGREMSQRRIEPRNTNLSSHPSQKQIGLSNSARLEEHAAALGGAIPACEKGWCWPGQEELE